MVKKMSRKEAATPPSSPDWRLEANFYLFAAGAVKEEGESIVPVQKFGPLIQKGADLMGAVNEEDEEKALGIIQELKGILEGCEAFIVLALMRNLSMQSDIAYLIGSELTDRLKKVIDQADLEKQNGNMGGINTTINEGLPILKDVLEKMEEGKVYSASTLIQHLLKRKRK